MKQKKKSESSGCRYGCMATEDMYHVFVMCGRFSALRGEARELIVRRVEKRIEEFKLEESHTVGLLKTAKLFFYDSDIIWPLHYSVYYLGHVPKLDSLVAREAFANTVTCMRFLHNIHGDFHLAGIRLASRIWGAVQKDMARLREGIGLGEFKL
jgi:hypothetical protein